jgi:hypothetical protein
MRENDIDPVNLLWAISWPSRISQCGFKSNISDDLPQILRKWLKTPQSHH